MKGAWGSEESMKGAWGSEESEHQMILLKSVMIPKSHDTHIFLSKPESYRCHDRSTSLAGAEGGAPPPRAPPNGCSQGCLPAVPPRDPSIIPAAAAEGAPKPPMIPPAVERWWPIMTPPAPNSDEPISLPGMWPPAVPRELGEAPFRPPPPMSWSSSPLAAKVCFCLRHLSSISRMSTPGLCPAVIMSRYAIIACCCQLMLSGGMDSSDGDDADDADPADFPPPLPSLRPVDGAPPVPSAPTTLPEVLGPADPADRSAARSASASDARTTGCLGGSRAAGPCEEEVGSWEAGPWERLDGHWCWIWLKQALMSGKKMDLANFCEHRGSQGIDRWQPMVTHGKKSCRGLLNTLQVSTHTHLTGLCTHTPYRSLHTHPTGLSTHTPPAGWGSSWPSWSRRPQWPAEPGPPSDRH